MKSEAADPHRINFSWLVRLRWGAIAGQIATIWGVVRWMHLALPLGALAAVIGLEALSNLGCQVALARGARPRERWLASVMAFDTLVLTALLALTGGPFNPFSFLYLVQIALAAVVLRARYTWALVGLAMVCSAVLFAVHRDLPLGGAHEQHMRFHLEGMWVAFAVAAAFIVYFLMRVTGSLRQREADLQAAREQAARQERLLSLATLAAGAAHELSTPLSTIALAAKELERGLVKDGPAAALDDARLIRSQVERCRAILEQLAADAGQSAGEGPSEVSIGEIVERARSGLKPEPAVRVEAAGELLERRVRLPPRAIAQALRGLIKNAQDASGGGEVRIAAAVDGVWLRLEVGDRGHGMAAEVLARAGEPFFTTKAPGRGMGLGLFLSRTVTERLGGRLDVASRPGEGTTVTLHLPIDAAAAHG